MIKTGAFDGLDKLSNGNDSSRDDLLFNLDRFLSIAQNSHQARKSGQGSLFDILKEEDRPDVMTIQQSKEETPQSTRLAEEKDLLGIYISEHPFQSASIELSPLTTSINEIDTRHSGQNLLIAGLVINSRTLTTKDGRSFKIIDLEDLSGSIEIAVWQETLEKTRDLCEEGNIIYCSVRLQERKDRLNCSVIQAHKYEKGKPLHSSVTKALAQKRPVSKPAILEKRTPSPGSHSTTVTADNTSLRITLLETQNSNDDQDRLRSVVELLNDNDGDDLVYLTIKERNGKETELKLPESKTSQQLKEEISINVWVAIGIAAVGIMIMAFGNHEKNTLLGFILGIVSAIGFSVFSVSLRWRKETPKFTTVALAGLFCCLFSMVIILQNDLKFLSSGRNEGLFALHGTLVCLGLILYSIGSKAIPAAELTLLSLTEVIGGIFWVWIPILGINETPSNNTIIGGFLIFMAITYYSLVIKNNKRFIGLN